MPASSDNRFRNDYAAMSPAARSLVFAAALGAVCCWGLMATTASSVTFLEAKTPAHGVGEGEAPVPAGVLSVAQRRAATETIYPSAVVGTGGDSSTFRSIVAAGMALAAGLGTTLARRGRQTSGRRQVIMLAATSEVAVPTADTQDLLPRVDRSKTKSFRKELMRSGSYFRFGKTQMEEGIAMLNSISGSELVSEIRSNGFHLTLGDVTFILAESYGFCWGVERAVAMAYEARNFFPDKNIWVTNEIIHNPDVNKSLNDLGMKFIPKDSSGQKDFSGIMEGDVVVLPAFGASVDEMALFKERNVQIVDTTCPWVSKVWNSIEKSKGKGHTSIIHGKVSHEETVATVSFAERYVVVKDMDQAEYVANYILGMGDREEFLQKFAKATSDGFDPDTDLDRVGVANQTTMLKGETELIGKLFERTMIKKYGPQNIDQHFVSFNTICDATHERQGAMYKMLGAEYEAPTSELYSELEGAQAGINLQSGSQPSLSSKAMENIMKGAPGAPGPGEVAAGPGNMRIDFVLVVGGFNSSNTTHLLEIAEAEGVPGYHIDNAERISDSANQIVHKPLSTTPADAMQERGLEVTAPFLPVGPIVVGVTSGASTPDNIVGDSLKRLLAIRAEQSLSAT